MLSLFIVNLVFNFVLLFWCVVFFERPNGFFIILAGSIIGFIIILLLYFFVFRISLDRALEAQNRQRQLMLLQENSKNLQKEMEHSRKLYHDLRQLLRQLHTVSDTYHIEELEPYIQKIVSLTEHTDTFFCKNPCLNAIFQYYAGCAREENLPIHIQVDCDVLPVDDADLTVLFGNALENALTAAAEYRDSRPGEDEIPMVSVIAGVVENMFTICITNPCVSVKYAHEITFHEIPFHEKVFCEKNVQGDFLPADAFVSIHKEGGYGLKRMELIAEKYGGIAQFMFDEEKACFTTRLTLSMQ